jgi:hypothetical protein
MPRFFDIDDTLPVYDPPVQNDTSTERADAGPTPQEETAR